MEDVFIALIGSLQIVVLAYLEHNRRQVRKQCGNASCVKAIREALKKDMSEQLES